MKIEEKKEAIKLRKSGFTYREISRLIPVSKSSLSYWLRNIELTDSQKQRIYDKDLEIRTKFIEYNKLKHEKATLEKEKIFRLAKKEIDNISKRVLKLIGIALYWAEGYKGSRWTSVSFTNSDPEMIKLMMKWFRIICKVPNDKIRIRVQCHGTDRINDSEKFWSKITNIPLSQFIKTYAKISPTSKKKMGDISPYGVCNIRVSNISLLTKIKGWIKGLGGAIV